jgi:hypothetical protein
MSNIKTWYLVCALLGFFFCAQPFWPWVVSYGGEYGVAFVFGYGAPCGRYAAGAFLALILALFVTGRMAVRPLWYALAAVAAGATAAGILFIALDGSHKELLGLKEGVARGYQPERIEVFGAVYWALAMGALLVPLGAFQLRGLLAARPPSGAQSTQDGKQAT